MLVGIDCRLLDRKKNTGISRFTEFIIKFYIEFVGERNIILITNDNNFRFNNCLVVKTRCKPYNIFDFFRYPLFLKSINLDILHSPFYSGVFIKYSKFKNILTVHDLMYRTVSGFFGTSIFYNFLKIKYFDLIIRSSLKNADAIVTVSETTKDDLFNIFKYKSLHIPEEIHFFGKLDKTILEKHNLIHKSYFFYCGNNRPHKNINFIKQVFSKNLNLPNLVLAGSDHIGCDNVIALGQVSEEELAALYKSSIAFIFPSYYEGFGLPILESLYFQTLVIASDIKAFREFKSKNILFFNLGNTGDFLNCLNESQYFNFVDDINFWEKYSKLNIYKSYSNLFNEVLNDR